MYFFNQGSACRLVLDFDRGHYPARSSTPDRTPTSSIPDLQNPVSSDDNDEPLQVSFSSKIFSALKLIGLSAKSQSDTATEDDNKDDSFDDSSAV